MEILKALNILKPLYKEKGLPTERFGMIFQGRVAFCSEHGQVEFPIDIPFDCCPSLHQLQRFYSICKYEKALTMEDGTLNITDNNVLYKVECDSSIGGAYIPFENTQCFDLADWQVKRLIDAFELAKTVINKPSKLIDCSKECINFVNNETFFSNGKAIVKYNLGFNFPNFGFNLNKINMFLKLADKVKLQQLGVIDNYLICRFENDVVLYLQSDIKVHTNYTALQSAFTKFYNKNSNRVFPADFKDKVEYVKRLSNSEKTIYISGSSIVCGNSSVELETENNNFAFRIPTQNVNLLFGSFWIIDNEQNIISFKNDNFYGAISTIKDRTV